ncbi:MAG: ATP-binding protein [Nitrososphaeraceae archaeon]
MPLRFPSDPETRIIKDPVKILEDTMCMVRRSNQYSVCSVSDGLLYAHNHCSGVFKEILDRQTAGKHKGIRWVTNIEYNQGGQLLEIVKNFMSLGMNIRHVKGIPPISFGVTEKELGITVERMRGGSLNASAIFSNEPAFVEQFSVIFEELWDRGIDAKDRIEEIESETKTFIDIIHSPHEIQERYHELVASAKAQVLLFLPTAMAYRREEKIGIFKALMEAAARDVDIRLLFPSDEKMIGEKISGRNTEINQAVRIRNMKAGIVSTEARSKILVVDRKYYLLIELKNDSKEVFAQAVGSAIFSNSRSTVLSYITMFDSLWRQSELYEKLEAHDKMQKEFINIAAHELRTPIQPILSLSGILRDCIHNDPEKLYVAMILRNAKRLGKLTEDLLDVTRIEGNSLHLNKDIFNLKDAIAGQVKDFQKQADDSGMVLHYDDKDVTINADKARITQVIANLLRNAISFTERGGCITITSDTSNDQVVIRMKDTGVGISSEIYPKLFTKFATKSYQGTGLGLYISKSIIEAHGGRIWAENNSDGRGATFTFTLPIQKLRQEQLSSL